jgi:hypothetical protein
LDSDLLLFFAILRSSLRGQLILAALCFWEEAGGLPSVPGIDGGIGGLDGLQ